MIHRVSSSGKGKRHAAVPAVVAEHQKLRAKQVFAFRAMHALIYPTHVCVWDSQSHIKPENAGNPLSSFNMRL